MRKANPNAVAELPLPSDPQFSGRGMFPEGPGEDGRQRRYVANPLIIDGTLPPIRRPAPRLGEHNDEIFGALDRHPDGG